MFSRLPAMMKIHHLGSPMMKGSLIKDSRMVIVEGHSMLVNNTRSYSDDAEKENKEKNEAEEEIKMPGFSLPQVIKADNFFSKLTKEQIEELKEKYKTRERDN